MSTRVALQSGAVAPALPDCLRAHAKALMGAFGKLGAPITDWLEGYASQSAEKDRQLVPSGSTGI